ncbi:MAG: alpha-glucuronidase family glycosyl hydrolase, partial [Bacteroidota bacterium]
MMKSIQVAFFALAILVTACSKDKQTINIVISKDADKIENLAANELQKYLEIIYPHYQFPVTFTARSKRKIYVGRKENIPNGLLQESTIPLNCEGFSIYSKDDEAGIITASGSAGLLYGVYELLGIMGYSFMFSGDYSPSEKDNFSFEEWNLVNEPLV